jgi:hypothetical protein
MKKLMVCLLALGLAVGVAAARDEKTVRVGGQLMYPTKDIRILRSRCCRRGQSRIC